MSVPFPNAVLNLSFWHNFQYIFTGLYLSQGNAGQFWLKSSNAFNFLCELCCRYLTLMAKDECCIVLWRFLHPPLAHLHLFSKTRTNFFIFFVPNSFLVAYWCNENQTKMRAKQQLGKASFQDNEGKCKQLAPSMLHSTDFDTNSNTQNFEINPNMKHGNYMKIRLSNFAPFCSV